MGEKASLRQQGQAPEASQAKERAEEAEVMAGVERRHRSKGRGAKHHVERLAEIRSRRYNEQVQTALDSNQAQRKVGEAEVVSGEELSSVMRKWVVRFLADRPLDSHAIGENSWGEQAEFIGPMQMLTEHTEINIRRVRGICNGEFKYVPLTQAEALLIAIGEEYKLSNGEIRVIPNPMWTPEQWVDYMQSRGCG